MAKKSLAELLDAGLNESLQNGAEAEPSPDGPVEPPAPHTGEPGAQATPLRARPRHPYWDGKPITESALRELHLWPRAKPAPAAVAAVARAWPKVLAQSKEAFRKGGELASVRVLTIHLAENYSALARGGHPPVEMLRDEEWPDLAPTNPERVRHDTAVLMIVKLEHAIYKCNERGGAWSEAIEKATTPA